MNYLSKIKLILNQEYRKIVIIVFLYVLSAVLEVIGLASIGTYLSYALDGSKNQILKKLITFGIFTEERDNILIILGFCLIIIFLFKAVFNFSINRYVVFYSMNILRMLRMKLIASYLVRPYEDIMKINSSYYVNLIQNMTYSFSIDVLLPVTKMFGDIIVGIVLIGVLISVNWVALLILISLMGLLIFGYDILVGRVFNDYGKFVSDSQKGFIQNLNEMSKGSRIIRVLKKEEFFYNRANAFTNIYYKFHSKSQVYSTIPRYLIEFILITFVIILILYTLENGEELNSLIPTLSIFAVAAIRLLPVANSISSGITQARYGVNIVNTLVNELQD